MIIIIIIIIIITHWYHYRKKKRIARMNAVRYDEPNVLVANYCINYVNF